MGRHVIVNDVQRLSPGVMSDLRDLAHFDGVLELAPVLGLVGREDVLPELEPALDPLPELSTRQACPLRRDEALSSAPKRNSRLPSAETTRRTNSMVVSWHFLRSAEPCYAQRGLGSVDFVRGRLRPGRTLRTSLFAWGWEYVSDSVAI